MTRRATRARSLTGSIVWHGWADQLITAEETVDYYTRVQQAMGGAKKTSEFMRLFMASGVTHCAGGVAANFTCSSGF